ncbi:hypothetical protein GOP47_0015759 [Adiantum capillus-veneris]|uniref:Uncharacterized protein n=1 Tax=Adiantum capillus-veneris TaxID=13818 RepID=A0A9D4ZBI2_ADICA|nr:hypothetical protein GOP47_0015759 [Adiantum capillus-veneris]
MRVSADLRSGDTVLCMPRDLFREGEHSAFSAGSQEPQEDGDNSCSRMVAAMPNLRLLLPSVPSLHHHQCNSPQELSSSTAYQGPLIVPHESTCDVFMRAKGSSSSLSVNAGVSLQSPCREFSFQVVASLRSNPCSLASDVIAAIDFDETGSLFATGGIARKIRVCSYTALLSDPPPSQAFREDNAAETDDFEEERQLMGPHGKGRLFRNSRPLQGKRKMSGSEDFLIQDHDESALRIICTPAKLSSLKWRPLGANVIGCGDYDGVVTEWDVEQGLCLCERYEHSGQRIWSVDYSSWFPTLCASASGDGTVRLWTLNCERSIGVIGSPGRNSICCAEFSSDGPHKIAVACADSNVYVYDLRRLDSSLLCLTGHERAASYVRFLGGEELVSASIDSSVKLWDISSCNALGTCQGQLRSRAPIASGSKPLFIENEVQRRSLKKVGDDETYMLRRTFHSHKNVKNFVGLSVWTESGLIACGSETNEVFVYDKSKNEPIWQMKLHTEDFSPQRRRRRTEEEMEEELEEGGRRLHESKCFVGALCWREQGDHHSLLTANSQGTLQLVKVIPE